MKHQIIINEFTGKCAKGSIDLPDGHFLTVTTKKSYRGHLTTFCHLETPVKNIPHAFELKILEVVDHGKIRATEKNLLLMNESFDYAICEQTARNLIEEGTK